MIRYITRALSVPNHHFAQMYRLYFHFQFFENSRHPLPVTGRISKVFQSYQIDADIITAYPLEHRCGITEISTNTSLAGTRKSNLGNEQWLQLHAELHNTEYSDRVPVFCDGSVKDGRAGSAVWSENFKLVSRIRNNSSIFTAELNALYIAISFIAGH